MKYVIPATALFLLAGCQSTNSVTGEPATISRLNPSTMADPEPMGYSHISTVREGTLIFVAGQAASAPDGKLTGRGDLGIQADRAVDNVLAALAELNAGPENILYLRINVVGYTPKMLLEIAPALKRLKPENGMPPSSIFVGVESLVLPGMLIEIETIAAI